MHSWQPKIILFLIGTLTLVTPSLAQDEEHKLPSEEITATRAEDSSQELPSTIPTLEQAKKVLQAIPGATTLITEDEFRSGNATDLSDVLSLSPAVYIQSRFGGSETRISVRGSGIRQTFNASGIQLLRNGLPLSEADSNVRPQLISPLDIERAEVLPGANGLIYGATSLGGAINFVTTTGHTADRLRVRTSVGSFGLFQTQLSTGDVLSNGDDYYASFSILDQDGFRDNNAEETFINFYGNYGLVHNDDWQTRFHLTQQNSDLELPGSLTEAQIDADSSQQDPFLATRRAFRDLDVTRLDVQTTGQLDKVSQVDIGISIQDLEMDHPLPFGGADGSENTQERLDLGGNVRFQTMTNMFGMEHELYGGLFYADGDDDSNRFNQSNGVLNRTQHSESRNLTVYAEDRIHVNDKLQIVAGVSALRAVRDRDNIFPGPPSRNLARYNEINPKLGFLMQASDEVQYFGSIARSFEAPTEGNIANIVGNLKGQSAWTLELGSRGNSQSGATTWSGAVYYSMIEDELLSVEAPVGSGLTETGNAEDTIHAGIELAVGHDIPLGDDNLHLNGIFNISQFEFDGDSTFGNNDLPGIPQSVFHASATFEAHNGYYVGLNTDYSSNWNVDFANSRRADSFMIFGLEAGYKANENWSYFLEARNLTDEEYASNSGIADDVNGLDTRILNPGATFGVFVGVEFTM